jgi:hypothetical protein
METNHGTSQGQTSLFSKAIEAVGEFLGLILGFIPDVLKMLRNILKAIPPLAAGILVAFVVTWFFLNLLTGNDTVKIIFAIALCIVALSCMGWVFLDTYLRHKREQQREAFAQTEARERHQQRMLALQQQSLSSLDEKTALLVKLAEVLASLPPQQDSGLKNELESAMKNLIGQAVREV